MGQAEKGNRDRKGPNTPLEPKSQLGATGAKHNPGQKKKVQSWKLQVMRQGTHAAGMTEHSRGR